MYTARCLSASAVRLIGARARVAAGRDMSNGLRCVTLPRLTCLPDRHRRRRCCYATAGARLPRAWARIADPAQQQPLMKRQRLSTSASAEAAAQQQTAAGPAQQEQRSSPPSLQQQQQKKAKALVMPTPVHPPTVPADPAAWENAVLLVDKPQGWTSFDVCGKLRHALAALLRKRNKEVKVGHAGGCRGWVQGCGGAAGSTWLGAGLSW